MPAPVEAMNLTAFLSRGAAHAPSDADRAQGVINEAAETARKKWLNALLVDDTRAWMSIGQSDPGAIEGLASMLAIAGFAHTHATGRDDTPDMRVIRGALSAAAQCAEAGSVVTIEHARAFSSAAERARGIIKAASVDAIIHASQKIRETVGIS